MIEVLDVKAVRRWAVNALEALDQAREEIDALNVYPVPDGDTGTNLYLTLKAACASALALPAGSGLRAGSDAFARGALLGARGNSGIIAAQFLRGWVDELGSIEAIDADAAKRAVQRADEQAWQAVASPVEGTILSVSRAASQAAATAGVILADVVSAAAEAARAALRRTPEQLDVLRRAGVVDAGGKGLVVLLDTLEALVQGRQPRPAPGRKPAVPLPAAPPPGRRSRIRGDSPAYEVMYLLESPADTMPALRDRLAALGDSLAVVGNAGLWHVHVHVDDPGAAIEAGMAAGRPRQIRITRFADSLARARPAPKVLVGLVACAAGPGLAMLFEHAGAVVVRHSSGRRPSTGELLDAIHASSAQAVIVLPNDSDTLSVARAAAEAARAAGVHVSVLPTRAQVHGLAAAAVHDPDRELDDDLVRMSAAAGATRDGAVTIAVRDAITVAGVCRAGDVLGVVQGDFTIVGDDLVDVASEVLDRLLSGGGELVTLVTGETAPQGLAATVGERLRRRHPEVEVSLLHGGQPRYPLLIAVE
jgi:DAK2 domain fusion protein YloV